MGLSADVPAAIGTLVEAQNQLDDCFYVPEPVDDFDAFDAVAQDMAHHWQAVGDDLRWALARIALESDG